MPSNEEIARRYIAAVEAGTTGNELAAFFTDDAEVVEMPNRMNPKGATHPLAEILAGAERGKKVMREQRYEITNVVADGDRVAMEFDWRGTLAITAGPLTEGTTLRAHISTFIWFRNGKIARQHTYDSYEPF